ALTTSAGTLASTSRPVCENVSDKYLCGPPPTQWLVARTLASTTFVNADANDTLKVKLLPATNSVVESESILGLTPRNRYGGSKASIEESSPPNDPLLFTPAPPLAIPLPSGTSTPTL